MKPFRLTDHFINKYQNITPPFGFNGFGELVFFRTYSRVKDDGTNEVWWETVKRVVEGCYNMQKRHILESHLGWDEGKAQRSAQEMYDRIFTMKFLPPGRGLWAMGSPVIEERENYAALFNCGFVSTEDIKDTIEEPFTFLMDMSMLGVGVGFDTKGAGKLTVQGFNEKTVEFKIPDSREGWVESVGLIIRNGFLGGALPVFDYSEIRPAGELIKGFGGYSSGPGPLIDLHERLVQVVERNRNNPLSVETIVDIQNMIGVCVVAGNVRRTAEIAFGDPSDEEYLGLKNYRWSDAEMKYVGDMAHRSDWGWTSNNSVFSALGMDYQRCGDATGVNGEPGYAWLENMRRYGRMIDRWQVKNGTGWKDKRAKGGNPCLEQTLESFEMCCLVETFPLNHENLEDYKRTLKFAYLYAKTVTLSKTRWEKTNRIMLRNRRIGCSQSGIQQFIAVHGIETYRKWCDEGYRTLHYYDDQYSEWFCIPRSIKMTSIKPSGTVSLLAGATPGMHWPEDMHYIRRMRLSKNSDLVAPLVKAGYHVEPCVGQEASTVVVEVPVKIDDCGGKLRAVKDVSLWEQTAMAAFIQRWWADNQVSCTVTFKAEDGPQIKHLLNYFQYDLKGISFLPLLEKGVYAQMPYEAITAEEFEKRSKGLKPIRFAKEITGESVELEPGCEAGACMIGAPRTE